MDWTKALFGQVAVLILLVYSGHEACAQWEVDLSAGGGQGRMRTDLFPAMDRGESQVVDRRFSWLLGGRAVHKLSGPVGFSTGLYWSFIAGHDEYWQQDVKIMETDRQVHYLSLPMMVHVVLGRLWIGAGYQLAAPLVQSGTFNTYPYSNGFGGTSTIETNDLGLKSTDFGVVGEVNCRITDRVGSGIRFYNGLQNVKDPSDGILWPLMNEQVAITLHYQILPRRRVKAEEVPVKQLEPVE